MSTTYHHMSLDLELPWNIDEKQEDFFKRLLKVVSIILMVLFLIIPWLPVFEDDYVEPEEKLTKTKVILEEPEFDKPPPPPPPPPPKKAKPKKLKSMPADNAPASRSAGLSGLAALSSQLSSLRTAVDVRRLQTKNVSNDADGKVTKDSRTLLGEKSAVRSSGGIDVDNNLMAGESTSLASHQSTSVDSPTGGGSGPSSKRSYGSNIGSSRDIESIRKVLEGQKGSVYALFYRALREKPDLGGKFVFELVIESDGSISNLKLVLSELGMAELEKNILSRIKGINFGAADVAATTLQYKFIFLPS